MSQINAVLKNGPVAGKTLIVNERCKAIEIPVRITDRVEYVTGPKLTIEDLLSLVASGETSRFGYLKYNRVSNAMHGDYNVFLWDGRFIELFC